MSFMFHPHPYRDPNAINSVDMAESFRDTITVGSIAFAKKLAAAIAGGAKRIAIDGYAGAELGVLRDAICAQLGALAVRIVDMDAVYLNEEAIDEKVSPSLPMDLDMDPVLLYGVRMERAYEDLMDGEKLHALLTALRETDIPTIVIGRGSLCSTLYASYDLRIWVDITPRQAALNFKHGRAHNLGKSHALPFAAMMRRNYYVDFELAIDTRWRLIREGAIDYYVTADEPEHLVMLPFAALCSLFDTMRQKPFRCRPVYLEGVWGGFYMKRLRNLPDEMRNCAWIFDMIPMEVSLVAAMGDIEIEVPFFTFVQQQGEKLLGREAFDAFGGYFPIRFNYDDTFHSGGNMSIQCHPGEAYLKDVHGELGRQDESYYICVAGDGAKTYMGFREEESCDAFLDAAQKALETGERMDYEQYIHHVESIPGTQLMIPAGTIHASGHNQVILEIGSLTVGSYTYKLYDYQRTDPQTGLPRPIHLKAGKKALRGERTAAWVQDNLVNHGSVVRADAQGTETVVGEHSLMYFSLRTLRFEKTMDGDTAGTFHVLTLTEGERVRIQSKACKDRYYIAKYLDIVVVPQDFGPYTLINEGQGIVTVHKTMLKDGFANG